MNQLNKLKNKFRNRQGLGIVSVTYEEIGLFPRSFSRVTDRFLQQIFSDVDDLIIHEYRFYRYLFFTTFKSLLILFCVPFLVNFIAKHYIVRPLAEYLWNGNQTEIFLNTYQKKRAFLELKEFEEKLYFESLIGAKENSISDSLVTFNLKGWQDKNYTEILPPLSSLESEKVASTRYNIYVNQNRQNLLKPDNLLKNLENGTNLDFLALPKKVTGITLKGHINSAKSNSLKKKNLTYSFQKMEPSFTKDGIKNTNVDQLDQLRYYVKLKNLNRPRKNMPRTIQEKTIELAMRYNVSSIEAITNVCSDLISFWTLCYLLFALEIQINITKSFLLEVFFGLDDSKKSLLILLITDLLVGYHSSNIWELFFEFIFDRYGFAESQTGVFLLVATLPVLLDVLFKYLIFRHLNRTSPATVATYHAMIE